MEGKFRGGGSIDLKSTFVAVKVSVRTHTLLQTINPEISGN